MTITPKMLDSKLQTWFRNKRNSEKAKAEILILFSEDPDSGEIWNEQDICEQSRMIIDRRNRN